MIKGKLNRKKGFKTFFVDRNGTRLMDGNVASTIHRTRGQRTSWAVNIQISETNPLSGEETGSSACNTDRKLDSDHPLIISRLISSVYQA